jgi:hypothetical protein
MLRFYETIERATEDVPPTIRGYAWRLPKPENIYLPPIEATATAALDEAASTKADADIQARIAQERAMWENARVVLAKARANKKAKEAANDAYK